MVRMVKSRTITASGAPVALTVPAGETFDLFVNCIDPDNNYQPIDLTGGQLLCTVRAPDGSVVVSRQATILDAVNGAARVPFVVADVLTHASTSCDWDLWFTDASGNRTVQVPVSLFYVTDVIGQPGQAVTVPPEQNPLTPTPTPRVADTVIPQYALLKPSATNAGHVALWLHTDSPFLVTGVAMAAATLGQTIAVLEVQGVQSAMLSDGTSAIAAGDLVQPSLTVDGRIMKGTANPIGAAMSAAAATLDAQVQVL